MAVRGCIKRENLGSDTNGTLMLQSCDRGRTETSWENEGKRNPVCDGD